MKLQPWFSKRLSSLSSFQDNIIRLENFCSTLYATAFLFVMATISLCLFLIFCVFLAFILLSIFPNISNVENALDNAIGAFTLIFALPYFIDFITLSSLKRLPYFWRVYQYPYRLMSAITMASVYRGIYYGLVSNLGWWRIGMLMTVYLAITYLTVFQSAFFPLQPKTVYAATFGTATMDGYYRDKQPDRFSTEAHIQSQLINDGVLHIFLPHKLQFEEQILADCAQNLKSAAVPDSFASEMERNLACLSAVYVFYVDGIEQTPGRFFMRELGQTNQLGLETWLDVAALPRGEHLLEVKVRVKNEERLRAAIPFFQFKN